MPFIQAHFDQLYSLNLIIGALAFLGSLGFFTFFLNTEPGTKRRSLAMTGSLSLSALAIVLGISFLAFMRENAKTQPDVADFMASGSFYGMAALAFILMAAVFVLTLIRGLRSRAQ